MEDLVILKKIEEIIDERIFLVSDEEFENKEVEFSRYVKDTENRVIKLSIRNIKKTNSNHSEDELFFYGSDDLNNIQRNEDKELDLKKTLVFKLLQELKNIKSLDLSKNRMQTLPKELYKLKSLVSLNLSYNQLKNLPGKINLLENLEILDLSYNRMNNKFMNYHLKNIRNLNLSRNNIQSIPPSIFLLKTLINLDISNNLLNSIPKEIKNVSNLEELNISNNPLTTIPHEFRNLEKLRVLNLSNTKKVMIYNEYNTILSKKEIRGPNGTIYNVEDDLFYFPNLEVLDLSNNNLSRLNIFLNLEKLKKLKVLKLKGNKFLKIPEKILQLKNLCELEMSFNRIKSIPMRLIELEKLNKLNLGNNNITIFPEKINLSKNLESLIVDSNNITIFPCFIEQISNLKYLDCSNNNLKDIGENIYKLANLEVLNLSKNKLIVVPRELTKLKNIKELNLSKNELKNLPEEISTMINIKELDLSNNYFYEFPKDITRLYNLEKINLSNNKIKTIPNEIESLKKIEFLNIENNNIEIFDFDIRELKDLKELYLSGNKLMTISKKIGELNNLIIINLSNNKLNNLPKEILKLGLKIRGTQRFPIRERVFISESFMLTDSFLGEFNTRKGLSGIFINGNPIEKELGDIIFRGKKNIEIYLEQLESGKEEQNEVKIVLIGDGGAGKTSLVKRLFGKEFNDNESPTHGIIIESKIINRNNKEIKAHFWDFGGQQIMHSAHQFFLSKDTLYVLVVGAREHDTKEVDIMIRRYLNQISTFGGDSKVLVVITKTENNHSFDLNRKDLKEQYGQIIDFFKVSSKLDIGLDIFNKKLEESILDLPSIARPWKESWFKIKDTMENMKDNYITFQDFINKCNENGILDHDEQTTLMEYLNNLGIITRFTKFSLKDTNILNPRWVTNAIYRILNSKKLEENFGLLNINDINLILHSKDECKDLVDRDKLLCEISYNHQEQQYIINLMKEFQLCYEYENPKDTILVPALLAKSEPDKLNFNEQSSLKIRLRYNYLPDSVIPNFIVRGKNLIINGQMWRSGFIIEDKEKWKVLIRERSLEESLYIYINGILKRDAIPVILNYIRDINKSFEVVSVKTELAIDGIYYDYNNLLSLIEMKEETVVIPELKRKYDIREILGEYINVTNLENKEEKTVVNNVFNVNTSGGHAMIAGVNEGTMNQDNSKTNTDDIIRLFLEEISKSNISQDEKDKAIYYAEEIKRAAEEKKPKFFMEGLLEKLKGMTALFSATQGLVEATNQIMDFFGKIYG